MTEEMLPIDPWLTMQLIRLYKGMLNKSRKRFIHQKTLENGVMMIEWADDLTFTQTIFLHPNENYRKTK